MPARLPAMAVPHSVLPLLLLAAQESPAVPFVYHESTILFEASIGARPLLCLLDTGAEASAVDADLARTLGLRILDRVTVVGTTGSSEVARYRVPELTLAGIRVRALKATGLDLGNLLAPDGAKVEAIVGCDVLRRFAVEIDYDNRTLTLERPLRRADDSAPPATDRNDGVPMRLDRGVPRISCVLDEEIPTDLRIDTGASLFESEEVFVNVTTDDWERLRALDRDLTPYAHFSATGIGGRVSLPVARIASLEIGDIQILAPRVVVQPRRGYFATEGACGFLGNNLLEKRGRVRLDFPAGRLVL